MKNLKLLLILILIGCIYLSISTTSLSTTWTMNGMAICTEINNQFVPQICSDGAGGAIIIWQDDRIGGTKIYAQRIDYDGHIQWTANGIEVAIRSMHEYQYFSQVCSDGIGGIIIVWENRDAAGYADIYAQRIDSEGNRLWTANGTAICSLPKNQFEPQICSDGAGGAVIAWKDSRNLETTGRDIYAQRIDSNGNLLWMNDDLAICTANKSQSVPKIYYDGVGSAIIVWDDSRNFEMTKSDIYAQKINLSGDIQWTPNGTEICIVNGNQHYPVICSDGEGGVIITWEDGRTGGSYPDIYAQRINLNGILQWNINGTPICTAIKEQRYPLTLSDGCKGAFIVWDDNRNDLFGGIYIQRIDSDGNIMWNSNGTLICDMINGQWVNDIYNDGNGEVIIVWHDGRNGIDTDIYAQNIDLNGNYLWENNGSAICMANGNQHGAKIFIDGAGGIIIVWDDNRNGLDNSDIYAQRIVIFNEQEISFGDCYILFLIFNVILLLFVIRKKIFKKFKFLK